MKFKENDILYYVCPFIFSIEIIKITMGLREGGVLYYIDETGAYLKEDDLFKTLNGAKDNAFKKLTAFYYQKTYEIIHVDPHF